MKMVKKKGSSFGRAPPRSARSRLIEKGYQSYEGHFSDREEAQRVVVKLHKKGYQAQIVSLKGPMVADYGPSYVVMYRGG